ncbi:MULTISPECIES: plasmid transfer protein TraB [Actinomycetes]|uniref:Sporulation protein SsgA n=1 Tax=Streptomyces noursei TaxID=1971 RepID=A0A2N8P434_STRNR|nr:plasmid transfer protein TraB [Streptomyces noursei]PNE35783.1 sporulation protein SsgA [Streptomyces noursei]
MGENTSKDNEQQHEQQHEQQLKGNSGKGGVLGYLAHRAKPYLPPWLSTIGVGVASVPANWAWEGDTGAAVLLTLSSAGLTTATWLIGKTVDTSRRTHATATVAAGTGWLTAAALAGPLTGPVPTLFGVGGAALAASWNIRQIMRRHPELAPSGESSDGRLKEAIGLAKAKLTAPRIEPNRVTVGYELPAGGTNEEAARSTKALASALDVPATAVRHTPDPESARRGTFTVVPVDMLKEVIWWPGPSAPGGSIADPIVIGVYDNGDLLMLTVPEALHLLIMGMTGSGKTEGAIDILAEILTRRDVIAWLSDPKRGQDLGAAFAGCDWVVEDGAGAETMIEALKAVVPARQRWLGAHSYREWTPQAAEPQTDPAHSCQPGAVCGCPGMPYLVAWFEEAANTLRAVDEDAFTGIAQEARSAGAWLVVSMQRASGYQISTDTRASLPAALCFGVDERDAGFALPSEVLDAGANPGAWGNKRPGYCYLVAKGVADELWSTPGRTYRNDPVALEWAVREFAGIRMQVDPVTAQAAAAVVGTAYTDRPRPTLAAPATVAKAAAIEEEADDMPEGIDPEDAHIDPQAELPDPEPGDDASFVPPAAGHKPAPEEARRLLETALREFEAAGRMVVGPKDFMDWCDRNNYSRPWISARLGEAARAGRLEPTGKTGRYRIVPALTPA